MIFRARFALLLALACPAFAQTPARVNSIQAPKSPLPSEEQSRGVTKFAFVAYGDTRGRRDGQAVQYEHSLVVDAMIRQIKNRAGTEFPVKFVLQSGDAVVNGGDVKQWNVSFVPLIDRITTEAGIPYFLAPGNHDLTTASRADAPERKPGLTNFFDAMAALMPKDGSPRRLAGYPTYAFGYGNTFFIALDSNISTDDKQFSWVKAQLEGLDRSRYKNVIVFCHHSPFSSGPHGAVNPEVATLGMRSRYMPLFQTHHVKAVFAGHEHLFEHWVERYIDASGSHRMDLVVSGGGGAPLYLYRGEPSLTEFLGENKAVQARLEHLVKPGSAIGSNPYHYLVVRVDGEQIRLEVFGVDWGVGFQPYTSSALELKDDK